MDVELDAGGAGLERRGDGVQGRRRALPRPALVGVGDDPAFRPHGDGSVAGTGRGGHGRTVASAPPCWTTSSPNSSPPTGTRFEAALLQRQAVEERFQVDVFLGDVSFETSYSLPGEERPARIRVDTSLDWPTWSQTAYRSWAIGEEPDELPEVLVEIAFRVQGLDGVPEVGPLLATCSPSTSTCSGTSPWPGGRPPSSRC